MTEKQRKQRDYNLRYRYGIGIDDYEKMLKKQGGKCAICGNIPKPGQNYDIDHCHKTGYIRGILCRYCNTKLLKHLRDNKNRAKGLVKYLQKAIKGDKTWT